MQKDIYRLEFRGADEYLEGKCMELTEEEVAVIQKVFGGDNAFHGEYNSVVLVNLSQKQRNYEAQVKAKEDAAKAKREAEQAIRDKYIVGDSHGSFSLEEAFRKALAEKAV